MNIQRRKQVLPSQHLLAVGDWCFVVRSPMSHIVWNLFVRKSMGNTQYNDSFVKETASIHARSIRFCLASLDCGNGPVATFLTWAVFVQIERSLLLQDQLARRWPWPQSLLFSREITSRHILFEQFPTSVLHEGHHAAQLPQCNPPMDIQHSADSVSVSWHLSGRVALRGVPQRNLRSIEPRFRFGVSLTMVSLDERDVVFLCPIYRHPNWFLSNLSPEPPEHNTHNSLWWKQVASGTIWHVEFNGFVSFDRLHYIRITTSMNNTTVVFA